MSATRPGDTKYAPLGRYLQALPAAQDAVTLTLADVERLLATTLPAGARTPGFWTGNGALQRALQVVGWHATLPPDRTAVHFRRGARGRPFEAQHDHAAMIAAYRAGTSVQDIAHAFDRHLTTVYTVLRQAGVVLRAQAEPASGAGDAAPTPAPPERWGLRRHSGQGRDNS